MAIGASGAISLPLMGADIQRVKPNILLILVDDLGKEWIRCYGAQAMKKHGFDDWAMWTGFENGNKASAKRSQDAYINTPDGSRTYEGRFGPDVYADCLIEFMKQHRNDPMCLYFPMALTHGPLVPTPDEPEAKTPLGKHKAMVRYTDKLVGRLVKTLDGLAIRERTIMFFTTDNGSGGRMTGTLNGQKVRC